MRASWCGSVFHLKTDAQRYDYRAQKHSSMKKEALKKRKHGMQNGIQWKYTGDSQTLLDSLTHSRLEVLSHLASSEMFLIPHRCSFIKFCGSLGSRINRTAMVCAFAHLTASSFIPDDLHTITTKVCQCQMEVFVFPKLKMVHLTNTGEKGWNPPPASTETDGEDKKLMFLKNIMAYTNAQTISTKHMDAHSKHHYKLKKNVNKLFVECHIIYLFLLPSTLIYLMICTSRPQTHPLAYFVSSSLLFFSL